MKEILKFLRQMNNLTQTEVAEKLGVSRQTYIKYENGIVVPRKKTVELLGRLYNVSVDFIIQNRIPVLTGMQRENDGVQYAADDSYGTAEVASSVALFEASEKRNQPKSYDAIFDGNTVRVLNVDGAVFKAGQKFRLVEVTGEEDAWRRKKAWETMLSIISKKEFCNKLPDDDPYYKEALYEALKDKYDSAD